MKNEIRRSALKIGIPFVVIMTLVLVMALPVLADNTSKPNSGLHIVQGEVISVASDNSTSGNATIVIQNGNQLQVTIKVDANTKYFMVPAGKASAAVSGTVKVKTAEKKANKGQSKKLQVAESTEAAITANCGNGADWWNGKEAGFSDIQV